MAKKKKHKKLIFPFVLGLFPTLLAIYGFRGEFDTTKQSSLTRRSLYAVQKDDIGKRLDLSEFLSPSIPPILGSTQNAPSRSIELAPTPAVQNHSPNINIPITKSDTRISPTNEIMPPVHSTTETPYQPPTLQAAPPPVIVQPPLNTPSTINVPDRPPMNSIPPVSSDLNKTGGVSVSPVSSRNIPSSQLSPSISSNNITTNVSRPIVPSLPPLRVSPAPKKLPSPLSSPNVPVFASSPKKASDHSPSTPLVASPPVGRLFPVHNNASNKAPIPSPPKEISSHLSPSSPTNSRHADSPVPATSPVRQRKRDPAPIAPAPKEKRAARLSHRQGSFISPEAQNAPAPSGALIPKNNHNHRSSPPINHGPSISPSQVHPGVDNNIPSSSPVISPTGEDEAGSPSPSPVPSSPFIHHKHRRPAPVPGPAPIQPETIISLPPPPPNLYCTPLSCTEPFTNSPSSPGFPCTCVLPIKVGLRLSVSLYSFFTLVSSLASELASSLKLTQSQVRVMGANSALSDAGQKGGQDRTDVLVDLVPIGVRFDANTALWVYQRFWNKEVAIQKGLFGEYEVLYVDYPGLPSSPPVGSGADSGKNNGRSEHPLAADVRKNKEKQKASIIAITVLSSIFALILFGGAIWFLVQKLRGGFDRSNSFRTVGTPTSKPSIPTTPHTPSKPPLPISSSLNPYKTHQTTKTFALSEISESTSDFHELKLIGEGGFGRVYAGILSDGQQIAVKVLKREDQQGGREFFAEVEMLSRLHHRNLVSLMGICVEGGFRCLVYELVPNGSVESHLYGGDKNGSSLDWNSRLKIALGSARALAYMHEDSNPRVIHRDFKASNILLENDFTPKVSDFGLAKAALPEGDAHADGHISTRVMGTFGYVAPEYAMTGHLLVKSDVYSYGVVLLELLTGRKPVDMSRPPGQENLVTWALPLLTSNTGLKSIIDRKIDVTESVAKVAAIASMCVQPEVDQRPFMGEVVQALKLVVSEGNDYDYGDCDFNDNCHDESESSNTRLDEGLFGAMSASPRFEKEGSGSFRRDVGSGPVRSERDL